MTQHELSRKRLIICPQDKGGIGKSFVTTLIYDYLTDHKVKLKTFDLDHANSTFHRYVPESHFIDTDVDTDKLAVLDTMINALEGVDAVLVDNRASGGTKILQYIQESQIIELQSQLHFDLVFVVIVLDDKDAISQIADLLDEYEESVRWLVVKNYRDSSQLSLFDQSQTRQRLEAMGALEIAVPCLTEVTRNKLQFFNLTVAKGRSSDKLHLLDRTRCARFHDVMAAEFDKAKDLLTWTRPTS
jgi:hypothetical protein